MSWNIESRNYFFNNTTPVGNDSLSEADPNHAFQQRYCSDYLNRLLIDFSIDISQFRAVINILTTHIPSADHSTPEWSSIELPLVIIGKGYLSVRKNKATTVISGHRIGLCIIEGKLRLWATNALIEKYLNNNKIDQNWKKWHSKYYYFVSKITPGNPLDVSFSVEPDSEYLLNFLSFFNEFLQNKTETDGVIKLQEVLNPVRHDLGEPGGWSAIYPKLNETSGLGSDNEFGEVETISKRQVLSPPKISSINTLSSVALPDRLAHKDYVLSHQDSMLNIIREVALKRVRTVIPNFTNEELNSWIMSTGYTQALTSHQSTLDLMYVYAASITNAGGRKPDFSKFGEIIRKSFRLFITNNVIKVVPSLQELAVECAQHLHLYPLKGNFDQDILDMARIGNCRITMKGLLTSVIYFAQWLIDNHGGSATIFHNYINQPQGPNTLDEALQLVDNLRKLPWMGVATAANFLKDSQVPSIDLIPPIEASHTMIGWFVKPDLHVVRLMGYLTGRIENDGHNPQKYKLGQALALYTRNPRTNFIDNYHEFDVRMTPDMRVIADVYAWALQTGTSALEIDRLLYLIGVKTTNVNGVAVNTPWYETFVNCVDGAIYRNVPRKS